MPLHLLGKKSWNVYNADNIARVKADEAAAAAREAAEEQRVQEIDAARRAAILRGEPPPEEKPQHGDETGSPTRRDGHNKKRRKLAGEDDTDRDIRLAAATKGWGGDETEDPSARLVRLRKPTSDAPLIDHAGNINLFPIDIKERMKREKNDEVEREKRKKERALEDQYTMRFSNAAGRGGLGQQPWYASRSSKAAEQDEADDKALAFPDLENKNVWGNEDPLRQQREKSRIASNDPFALMQSAQVQLKKSEQDKKKWAADRDRELIDLRAAQQRSSHRGKHGKRKKRADDEDDRKDRDACDKGRSSSHKHRPRRRSRSRERGYEHSSSHRRIERRRSLSCEEERKPRDQIGSAGHHRRERKTFD